jgi:hypothetical protein
LDLRKKAPKFVIDEALAKCVATDGAFTCIERNFIKRNGLLPFPTRSWRKIGDPESKYPKTNKISKMGLRNKRPTNENIISKTRVIIS